MMNRNVFFFTFWGYMLRTMPLTLLITEILSGKNVRAWVSMDFTQDKFSAPIAIEKIKILGAPWELPAKQHCQFGQFGPNLR